MTPFLATSAIGGWVKGYPPHQGAGPAIDIGSTTKRGLAFRWSSPPRLARPSAHTAWRGEPMKKPPITAARILDTALQLADACGWERLHLFDVAAQPDVGRNALAPQGGKKDELPDAWSDRADRAMLARSSAADLAALEPAKRLEELLVAWLDSLAAHRAVTGQMLLYKLEPAHLHLGVLGLLRISRPVKWWREGARR